MKLRLTINGRIYDVAVDFTLNQPAAPPPVIVPPVVVDPAPEAPLALPVGYASNPAVAREMLLAAVRENFLNPVDVQKHGDRIVAALKRTYPSLDVYLSKSDAPVWPGFGSVDVTIDSGKGGWYFRPDGVTPWKPIGSR